MKFFSMGNDGAVIKPPQACEEPLNIDPNNYVGKIYKKGKNIDAVKTTIDNLPPEFDGILYYKENYKCTINEVPEAIPTRFHKSLSKQQLVLRYVEGKTIETMVDELIHRNNDCDYFKLLIESIKTYYLLKELVEKYNIFYNDFDCNNIIYNENTNKLILIDLDTITYGKPKGVSKSIYRNNNGTYNTNAAYIEGDLAYPYWDKLYAKSIIEPILLSMTNALSLIEQEIVDVGEMNKSKFLERKTIIERILGRPITDEYKIGILPTDIDKFNLDDLYNKFCSASAVSKAELHNLETYIKSDEEEDVAHSKHAGGKKNKSKKKYTKRKYKKQTYKKKCRKQKCRKKSIKIKKHYKHN